MAHNGRRRRTGLATPVVALLGILVGIVGIVTVIGGAPASAATGERLAGDRRLSLSGGLVVAEGETIDGPVVSIDGPATIDGVVTDDVYVGSGNVRINGRVTGDVVVIDGDAIVSGEVGGDVVAVVGRAIIRDGAEVGGDVVSRREPRVDGTVRGEVKELDLESILSGALIALLLLLWVSVTVSVAILGLLFVLVFPRAADATVAAGRRVWPSLGWGALVGIVGPILAVLVLVTIVGIPLGLGALSALWFVACLYGLGALTIAAWRAGHGTRGEPEDGAPPPEEPAPPTALDSPAPSESPA
jgi:hypothetical protein